MTESGARSTPKVGGKRQRTRARLIEATLELAAEKGLAAASLDAIAARAGMTKGAIYSNFANRSELLVKARAARGLNLVAPSIPGGSFADHLRDIAEQLLAILARAPADARLIGEYHLLALTDPELHAQVEADYARTFGQAGRKLARGFGAVLTMPPEALAVAIQSLALGFLHQSLLTPRAVTREVVLAAFEALAKGAVREG
jgi:AcrR family transcriptional regulator